MNGSKRKEEVNEPNVRVEKKGSNEMNGLEKRKR